MHTTFSKLSLHAQNQATLTRAGEGQKELPLGIINRRSISHLAAGLTFAIKMSNKLEKATQIGSNESFEGVVRPETGYRTPFSWKMTHALSIGNVKRS